MDLLLHVFSVRISSQHHILELSIIYKTYKKGKKKTKTKYKQQRKLNCTERLIVSISKNSTALIVQDIIKNITQNAWFYISFIKQSTYRM